MKNIINKIIDSAENATPFMGSDESWEAQHGKNWRSAKKTYIAENVKRLNDFKSTLKSLNQLKEDRENETK
jgi:hypothetical protein